MRVSRPEWHCGVIDGANAGARLSRSASMGRVAEAATLALLCREDNFLVFISQLNY